jgi:3-hydroxyisobutyrate dehydrogenase
MKIGFIGLGHMGGHMARNVLSSGEHEMRVFDLSPDAIEALVDGSDGRAIAAAGPREAATGADIVFTSLPGPADVLEVALGEAGVLDGLEAGSVYVDLSTVSPQTLQSVADAATGRGVQVLDCPVSGGVGGAEAGTLCLMAGGDRETFDRIKPVLDLIGEPEKVLHCGDVGTGSVCKLVNNLIGLSTGVVLGEAFSMGLAAKVDPGLLFQVVMGSSGASSALAGWDKSVLAGNFEPGFALALAAKDVRLATDLARSLRIPMEMANLADQKYTEALRAGLGPEVSVAVVKLQEQRTGAEIRHAGKQG